MVHHKQIEDIYWGMEQESAESDSGCFDAYFGRFTEAIKAEISQKLRQEKLPVPELREGLLSAVTGQLQKIGLRTLILELQVCEQNGELCGKLSTERYRDFAGRFLSDKAYLDELYELYPVLYRSLMECAENAARNIIMASMRFEADKREINRRFFADCPCERITGIDGGTSDLHRGGQQVYHLELDNGKRLIYKPHSLALDETYRELLQWISQGIGIDFWWNEIWDRGEYGWCQWVETAPCKTGEELAAYYKRNGILLGMSYLLGSEDMHYENLIAHGAYPVLVDLEMGIGTRGCAEKGTVSDVERVYRESVLQSGLLPLYTWNEAGEAVNVGAINGDGGQIVPVLVPAIRNAGTVDMQIVYQYPVLDSGKNLATLNGDFAEPYLFLSELKDGFAQLYRFCQGNLPQLKERLKRFCNAEVRYLLRDSQQYALLLLTSYSPKYLTETVKRSELFTALCSGGEGQVSPEEEWRQKQEVAELIRGDIPYFWYRADGVDLYSGTGAKYPAYFQKTAMECIWERIARLDEETLRHQLKWIEASLRLGTKQEKRAKGNLPMPEIRTPEEIAKQGEAAADAIGQLLLEEAIWSEDRNEVGWISMMEAGYQEKSCLIRPMGYYLYDGLAGMMLFFARLAEQTKEKQYREIMQVLQRMLYAYTEKRGREASVQGLTGAYTGEASIALAYLLRYADSREEDLLRHLDRQLQIVHRMLRQDECHDVLSGNAGAILVLLTAYEITGKIQYLHWASEAGEQLVQAAAAYDWGWGWVHPAAETALTGFAHGAGGIMLALVKLWHNTGNPVFREAAYQAYRYEEHYYCPARRDWADLRYPEESGREASFAWCHGRGGILAARRAAAGYTEGVWKEELEKKPILPAVSVRAESALCLCHGAFGAAAMLSLLGEEQQAGWVRDSAISLLYRHRTDIRQVLHVQECENYGLLGGIAGIGYGCIGNFDEIRRILLL